MPGRVRTRRQFGLLTAPSSRGQSGPLRISVVERSDGQQSVDVAYAISRKVGNAVQRNKIRRRLRALLRNLNPQPQSGLYLIRCGFETGRLTYEELQHHLQQALRHAGQL